MYGQQLILGAVECNVKAFTYYPIWGFLRELCDDILDVERLDFVYRESEPGDSTEGNPKTHGVTAVQILVASSVTLHACDLTGQLFLDVFSCGDYEVEPVKRLVDVCFGGRLVAEQVIER